jgi:hypothetical protein
MPTPSNYPPGVTGHEPQISGGIEDLALFGEQPNGTATGFERWVRVTADDGDITINGYRGWVNVATIRLSGDATRMEHDLAENLYTEIGGQ